MGIGDLSAGSAISIWPALPAFALAGFGNGLFLVHQRLLFQTQVADHLRGRVFAVNDGMVSWGFTVAFLSAGALATRARAKPREAANNPTPPAIPTVSVVEPLLLITGCIHLGP